MIVQNCSISKSLNRIEIESNNGTSVFWGWGKDELVVFVAKGDSRETLYTMKDELKKLGYRGSDPISKPTLTKIKSYLNERFGVKAQEI